MVVSFTSFCALRFVNERKTHTMVVSFTPFCALRFVMSA